MSEIAFAPLICTTCAGTGFAHGAGCAACNGAGLALSYDGRALTWGLRLDGFSIVERRVESAVRGAVNFFLLLVAAFGAFALGWEIWSVGFDYALRADFWISGSLRITFFWITAWSDAYLAYRLIRESERVTPVLARPYISGPVPEPRPMTFEEFGKTRVRERVDISRSFSASALTAIEAAYSLAERQSHAASSGVHLFASLLADGSVGHIFQRLGADPKKLKEALFKAVENEAPRTGAIIVSPEFYRILFAAYLEAVADRAVHITSTALFAALVRESAVASEILDRAGIDPASAKNAIAWVRGDEALRARYRSGRHAARFRRKGPAGTAMTGLATPFLEQYADDLTEIARLGGYFPITGRETELKSIFRALEGGKRSVVLVGERGVGKDSLLTAIAERMVEEAVPTILSDKRLLALSIPKLVAGGSAADIAARFDHIFLEVARARNVILAVPSVSSLIGITIGSGGGLDLAQVLGDAIGKGVALVIATATLEEVSKIDHSTLGASFEKVEIPEPDIDAAIVMVQSHAAFIEYEHKVVFSYAAIAKAVALSDRYLHGVALPEKGIEILKEVAASVRGKRGPRATITAEDVAEVVAEKSKVPVQSLTEDESAKLLRLEEAMHGRVVGQDEAVKAIASAVRRSRAELRSEKRPIANFLFLGPTGVGKTELAKTLAEVYFGSEDRMIRLDMSEYQTTESLYRLVGAPGSTTGGIITEAVRRDPFSLVLLDELEKAHPDILNVFLQVMEDGRLTDATGKVADFTNAIIIATSNAGTPVIQEEIKKGTANEAIKKRLIESDLKATFRPEFLNRFDGIVVFRPLAQDEIVEVARRMLARIAARLAEKGITLQVSEEAVQELAAAGFDPAFGTRPLRRVIQERVEDALATFMLQNKLSRRDIVRLGPGGMITVEKKD